MISKKTFIFAFELTFVFCFLLGIFWQTPPRLQEFNSRHWYFINRGYPIPWAGQSLSDLPVTPPLVKLPFLRYVSADGNHSKIIDLWIFTPLFVSIFLAVFSLVLAPFEAISKNKVGSKVLDLINICLGIAGLVVYFLIFARS